MAASLISLRIRSSSACICWGIFTTLIWRQSQPVSSKPRTYSIWRQSNLRLNSSWISLNFPSSSSSAQRYSSFILLLSEICRQRQKAVPRKTSRYSARRREQSLRRMAVARGRMMATARREVKRWWGSMQPSKRHFAWRLEQVRNWWLMKATNLRRPSSSTRMLDTEASLSWKPILGLLLRQILMFSAIEIIHFKLHTPTPLLTPRSNYLLPSKPISPSQTLFLKANHSLIMTPFGRHEGWSLDGRGVVVIIKVQMSTNRFGTYRPKLEQPQTKDLTPKSSKYSPKISPVFSSMRTGMTMKADPSAKIKIGKPSTTKNPQQESAPYFHSREGGEKRQFYNSNKRLELTKTSAIKNSYEYQPRSKSKSPAKQVDEIVREEIFIQPKTFNIEARGIRTSENEHPPLPKVMVPISNFQPAKHSKNGHGTIRAYSASTNQGPVREYNEDRVAIILNFAKPQHVGGGDWKKPAYFGVFDGHGGMDCADFLRDNLHTYISKEKNFPARMEEAVRSGFEKCEKAFLDLSYNGRSDKSGSCGLISFFYGRDCFISNVGDSRAIMSSRRGQVIRELSLDHKASEDFEQKRIIEGGGRIYQTKIRNANPNLKIFYEGEEHSFILGPHRAFPGRLSVTRTFGDIEAKFADFGGNSKAIICTPEISAVSITDEDDFIILACDGIYDKLSNAEVIEAVWETFKRDRGTFNTIHEFCGKAVENIMKLAFHKKTLDNITVVLIAFEGLEAYFQSQTELKPVDVNAEVRKSKGISKLESSFQRKYVGRSVSPSNYNSLRTKSYYRPS